MTQFIMLVCEYYWVIWSLVVSLLLLGICTIINNVQTTSVISKSKVNWTVQWWDVWNFYYKNYFNNLNNITQIFFQLSWKEWHVLDIRMFFVLLSIFFLLFIF